MLAAFKPRAFRDQVRELLTWKGVGKDLDDMVKILDKVNKAYVQHEAVEAANKAAADRNYSRPEDKPAAKKGGGQQTASSAPANARDTFRAPADGCRHRDDGAR